MELFANSPVLMCLAIFFARILDVSLGTVRTIMVFKGYRLLATIIGFFEVLIWVLVASKVISNLQHWYFAVSYAAGFAAGNYTGIWLESKLAMGVQLVRAISENTSINLASQLRAMGYSVTSLSATGKDSVPVEILIIVEKRRAIANLLQRIKEADSQAFFTIEDVKLSHLVTFHNDQKFPKNSLNSIVKKK